MAFTQQGKGPALLMVHGLLADSRIWNRVVEALPPTLCTIRCDLPGHGRTPRRPLGSGKDYVLDLVELIGVLRLPAVHLVAHGSGCSIAAAVALRAPQVVRSLTVIDPVIPRSEAKESLEQTWHMEMLLQWLMVGHGSVVRRPEHVAAIQQAVAQQTHSRFAADSPPPTEQIASSSSDMARLSMLTCPVLTLVGSEAPGESRSMATTLYGRAPMFEFALVPNANRHSLLEAPAVVADLLQRFLTP